MAEPTIQLGGGNWAGKSDNLLGYYKEGERFYKQDFTFSRSTTGTYTDSDGYIQEMPYNLFTYSNDFSNWGGARLIKTSGKSGYDGTQNGWKIIPTTANNTHYLAQSISASGIITISVYAKSGGYDYFTMRDNTSYAKFNLNNGVTSTNGVGAISSTINLVTDGWYKCTFTYTKSVDGNVVFYINNTYDYVGNFSGDETSGVYLQDAQLVKGSSAKTYFPTTTRLNMPRVSYKDNSNGSLILEPQRSNLLNYSSDFSEWTLISTVIDTNAVSPTGESNATTITDNGSGGASGNVRIQATNFTITASTQYTFSAYVKANPNSEIKVTTRNDDALRGGTFDISTLTFTPEQGTETGNVESFGNGFYRIIITWTSGSDTSIGIGIGFPNITRDGTNSFILWGTQVEQGSYATTLINTSGSSVTRNADACSLSNVADRINSSEGTIYGEQKSLETNFSYNYFASVSDGTNNNRLEIRQSSTGLQFLWRVGGTYQSQITKSNAPFTSFIKYALRYSSTDIKFYVNGSLVGTINSPTLYASGVLNNIEFADGSGNDNFRGTVKELKYYNTALSDSELATLTTL